MQIYCVTYMKKLKKNWLLIIIGLHIVLRFILYGVVTNDKIVISEYNITSQVNDVNLQPMGEQLVLKD